MMRRSPWLAVSLLAAAAMSLITSSATAQDAAPEEKKRESAHGSYEFKPSYGGGIELGYFFNDLGRWNTHLLKPNNVATFDVSGLGAIEGAFEVSPVENLRVSALLAYQTTLGGDPSLSAIFGGLEPMLTARRGSVEIGVGISLGGGGASLSLDSGEEGTTPFFLARPVIEGRYYLNEMSALYLRLAFEYWLTGDFESDDLTNRDATVTRPHSEDTLSSGNAYIALGVRFGKYPEHLKVVPDTDGDGLRDDVDDCPPDAEDADQFEDENGCPDLDDDKDGVPDTADQCKMDPEDKDNWKDEDGCPEADDDRDNDGLLDGVDKCPDDAEDLDGFEDADGCPDYDNDADGFCDPFVKEKGLYAKTGCQRVDKCPMEKEVVNGFEDDDGCPDESKITLTDDKIELNEQIFFDIGKDTIKPESFPLLDQVADLLKSQPRVKKILVEGHTDDAGDPKKNLTLSKLRSAAVVKYLMMKGVEATRMSSEGFGSTVPLVESKGLKAQALIDARTQNRRVEIKILELAPPENPATPAPAPAPAPNP